MNKITKANTDGLIEGYDYEIISYMILDQDFEFHTFKSFFGESINDYYDKFKGENYVKQITKLKQEELQGCQAYGKTPMNDVPQYFYMLDKGEVDIDLATNLGLGVIVMKNSELSGEYLLYSLEYDEDDEESVIDEQIRLIMYLQLTDKKMDSKKLDKFITGNIDYLKSLVQRDSEEVVGKLVEIYKNKKGGNNVIPFKSKNVQ